ncbi:MAG: copper amine oxidase N-terminal domain-containing protein [Caldiserica bacterium]|nr:copper amine oxidase N-terminal domain-containing protein [Caldisericota bacterium]
MKKTIIAAIAIVALVLGISMIAYAQQAYMDSFNANYPKLAKTKLTKDCLACHFNTDGSGERNPYGVNYENNGDIDDDFEGIEKTDADGDGYTNAEELKAVKFPGDFNDIPGAKKFKTCLTFLGANDTFKKKLCDYMIFNGKMVTLAKDGAGVYFKGTTMMVPCKISVEKLGNGFKYDTAKKIITITKAGKVVATLTLGKTAAKINGKAVTLPAAPELKAKTTVVHIPAKVLELVFNAKWVYIPRGKIGHIRF